jgi:hypothetical protein
VAVLGLAFITVIAIYQDPVPGERQDWLVRPIKRLDMLLAKLLFILVMAQGPMFIADLLQPLANGFTLQESLVAALGRGAYVLFAFTIPLFVIASVTRSFTEGVIGGLIIFLGCGGLLLLISGLFGTHRPNDFMPTLNTGIVWIMDSSRSALIAIAGATILWLQYFRRKTLTSRVLTGVASILWVLIWFIPWRPAFAVEKRFSKDPGAGNGISIVFSPSDGKHRNSPGQGPSQAGSDLVVYLPMRLYGVSTDSMSLYDHVETILTDAQGKKFKLNSAFDLDSHREGPNDSISVAQNGFHVPRDLYNRVKDQSVQLDIEYSFTFLKLSNSYAIPAVDGKERMPGFGLCATKVDDDGDEIELDCMNPGTLPTCVSAFLENETTGKRNPARPICNASYVPYPGRLFIDDIFRFGGSLRFRDSTGLAKFPVDGSQLKDARVVMRLFEPQDHFTRRLTIPNIVLKDWVEQ